MNPGFEQPDPTDGFARLFRAVKVPEQAVEMVMSVNVGTLTEQVPVPGFVVQMVTLVLASGTPF